MPLARPFGMWFEDPPLASHASESQDENTDRTPAEQLGQRCNATVAKQPHFHRFPSHETVEEQEPSRKGLNAHVAE